MDSASAKQQLTEALKQAESVVVTASQHPSVDQVASVAALSLMLDKIGKKVNAVISNPPDNVEFLPLKLVKQQLTSSRDFVVEIDASETEADKLKWSRDGDKVLVHITPFEGNFTEDDVSFSYGDYHSELVIGLGVRSRTELDPEVSEHKELLEKAKLATINNQTSDDPLGDIAWWEDASSISEMLMSMSEALESGVLDKDIATALLAGIIDNTEHFTSDKTTPKIMTMSAQLMAAGARQADIIKNLEHIDEMHKKTQQDLAAAAQQAQSQQEAAEQSEDASEPQDTSEDSQPQQQEPAPQPQPESSADSTVSEPEPAASLGADSQEREASASDKTGQTSPAQTPQPPQQSSPPSESEAEVPEPKSQPAPNTRLQTEDQPLRGGNPNQSIAAQSARNQPSNRPSGGQPSQAQGGQAEGSDQQMTGRSRKVERPAGDTGAAFGQPSGPSSQQPPSDQQVQPAQTPSPSPQPGQTQPPQTQPQPAQAASAGSPDSQPAASGESQPTDPESQRQADIQAARRAVQEAIQGSPKQQLNLEEKFQEGANPSQQTPQIQSGAPNAGSAPSSAGRPATNRQFEANQSVQSQSQAQQSQEGSVPHYQLSRHQNQSQSGGAPDQNPQ